MLGLNREILRVEVGGGAESSKRRFMQSDGGERKRRGWNVEERNDSGGL